MIVFPPCKINLGLRVLSKRSDGFHNIETVFYPVPLHDALEVILPPQTAGGAELSANSGAGLFSTSGLAIDGSPTDNLCLKALQLLKDDFAEIGPLNIHLHKVIPLGAGLGGGSSNGAFMLSLLNELFSLNLSSGKLAEYALQLGSDCPFFLLNRPCYAGKRGEHLEEIALDLSAYSLVLVNPGIHINTGWAFSSIVPSSAGESLQEAIQEPVSAWKSVLVNDFEAPVFELYPEIREIRDFLYQQGALYSAMTGTGSTVFGIFPRKENLVFPPACRHYTLSLS